MDEEASKDHDLAKLPTQAQASLSNLAFFVFVLLVYIAVVTAIAHAGQYDLRLVFSHPQKQPRLAFSFAATVVGAYSAKNLPARWKESRIQALCQTLATIFVLALALLGVQAAVEWREYPSFFS
jgi:hypothetical protein